VDCRGQSLGLLEGIRVRIVCCRVECLSKFVYSMLFESTQLCEWVPRNRQWSIFVTNTIRSFVSAWLIYSPVKSRFSWVEQVCEEAKCHVIGTFLETKHCAMYWCLVVIRYILVYPPTKQHTTTILYKHKFHKFIRISPMLRGSNGVYLHYEHI